MKISTKKIGSTILAALVVMYSVSPISASADESIKFADATPGVASAGSYSKDEIIYVNLAHDGAVDAIYVVNSFDMMTGGTISDRGDYSEVLNLTTTEPITLAGNAVSVNAAKGKFYYEGVLKATEIPWDISVRYSLDGKPIDGSELAGQNGQLQLDVGVSPKNDANNVWRDNYAVQASLSLDSEKCSDITAPDATVATVGGSKQLSYIILPGKEKEFTVTANVTDFELAGISFNMIPLSLSIDEPDTTEIKDKIYELQDGAVELDDGAFDLDDGATRLNDGVDDLSDGVNRLQDGASKLSDGVNQLHNGTSDLIDGVDELRDGANDLRDGAGDLLSGARDIRKGTDALNDGALTLENGARAFAAGLSQLRGESAALTAGSSMVKDGIGQLAAAVSGINGESVAAIQNQASQLKSASQTYLDTLNGLIATYEQQLAGLYSLGYSGATTYIERDIVDEIPETDVPEDAGTDEILQDETSEQQDIDAELENADGEQEDNAQIEAEEDTSETPDVAVDEDIYYYKATAATTQIDYNIYANDVTAQITALEQTIVILKNLRDNYAAINTGVGQMADSVVQQSAMLPTLAAGVQTLSAQYGQVDAGITAYTGGVGQLYTEYGALNAGISELSNGVSELGDGAKELYSGTRDLYDGTYDLQDGVRKLSDGSIDLNDGVVELNDGVIELGDGVVELADGTVELKDGTIELKDGTLKLLDGTNELREQSADMDAQVDEKIDEMIAEYRSKSFDPISFVDASNQNIHSVQFVMKTAEISVEDAAEDIAENEPEPTFWQRFVDLFVLKTKHSDMA